jgi:hypothetical protein
MIKKTLATLNEWMCKSVWILISKKKRQYLKPTDVANNSSRQKKATKNDYLFWKPYIYINILLILKLIIK